MYVAIIFIGIFWNLLIIFLIIKNGIDEFKVSNIFKIMPKRALGGARIDD